MRVNPALAAVVALSTLLIGGCGIPDNTRVVTVGPGPTAGLTPGGQGDNPDPVPPLRGAAAEESDFVGNYLSAAAASDIQTSVKQVRAYLDKAASSSFNPPDTASITVVHVVDRPLITQGQEIVQVDVQEVGQLSFDGEFTPASNPQTTWKMGITQESGGWVVTSPPTNGLVLSDTALNEYYSTHTIYFWNTDYTGLVPDQRYMANSVRQVQWPTVILTWLADGPSKWLADAVNTFGQNSGGTVGNVPPVSDQKLTVTLPAGMLDSLTGSNAGQRLNQLRDQLQWSLGGVDYQTLELRVARQNPVTYSDHDYLSANPGFRTNGDYEQFVLYQKKIWRLAGSSRTDGPPGLEQADANKNLLSAALRKGDSYTYIAVVADGKAQTLKVAMTPFGSQASLKTVVGLTGVIGQPQWASLTGNDKTSFGLVLVAGKLYSFTADGSAAKPVEWPSGGLITSFSIAPDGRRIALISDGKLFRTVLTTTSGQISISSAADRIQPLDLARIDAVAWGAEDRLVVAGLSTKGRSNIFQISDDGTGEVSRLDNDLGTARVTYLVAFPFSPSVPQPDVTQPNVPNPASYAAAGTVWALTSTPQQMTAAGLAPPQPVVSGQQPSDPFFLY